jgi:PKD repeat protein
MKVNSCRNKLILLVILLAGVTGSAFAQAWPLPAKTPNTDVLCNTSSCDTDLRHKDMKLIGYSAPITTFVGRYLDSVKFGVSYFPFRTARARFMRIASDRNRIYTGIGSAIAAYDINTFFSRVAAEEMIPIGQAGISTKPGTGTLSTRPERLLRWDSFFYAEESRSGWITEAGDGEQRLFGYDWDDRGYLYIATGPFGWGVIQDEGKSNAEFMKPIYQRPSASNATASDPVNRAEPGDPKGILVLKRSNGDYRLLVSDYQSSIQPGAAYNVNDPAHPKFISSNEAFKMYAKDGTGTHIALIKVDSSIQIITNDQSAVATAPGPFLGVASDGTNFIASSKGPGDFIVITVFTPSSGGGYSAASYTMTEKMSADIPHGGEVFCDKDSGGYFTMIVAQRERALAGAPNLLLFKLVNGVPAYVSLNDYVARHYGSAAPTGYTYPFIYDLLQGGHVVKRGSKYYLIIEDFSLGDVYELKGSDSITAKVKKIGRNANPSSKQPANSGPFYGDEITFTSDYTAAAAPSVTWDFGDSVVQTATPSVPDIPHQYGNLLASDLPKTRTVKATNAGDISQTDSLTVTLARPAARIGISGTSLVFTQPTTTNLTAPIVSSDTFVDASDGAIEGHYSEWRLDSDTASTKQLPTQTYTAGGLGQRTLTFTGHYGPYTGSGATLATTGNDVPFSVAVTYKVFPFVAVINGPTSAGTNVTFKSGTRVTTRTADLTGGSGALANYTWELLKPGTGNTFVQVGTPVTGGPVALSAVPDYVLPRSTFQGAEGWKARLTIVLTDPTALGNNTQYATSFAESGPLIGPTPSGIVTSGCGNVGAACNFTTPSTRADNPADSWTYAWTVTGPGAVPASSNVTFTPSFPVQGTYQVSVKVSNAIGDATLNQTVSVGPSLCSSAPTAANTAITYKGATSGCVGSFSTCTANESIDFFVTPHGWLPAACDTYSWNFGDGSSPSNLAMPSHTYTSNNTYTVTMVVQGGVGGPATVTTTVHVGNSTPPPPPPPPPPTGCKAMTPGNTVFVVMDGPTSHCTATVGNCATNESISFHLGTFNYDATCNTHTLSWNFGDNTPVIVTQDPFQFLNHTYANAGPYNLTLQINNGSASTTVTQTVKVSGSGGDPTSCQPMVAGSNVFIGFLGATSGCTLSTDTCQASEVLNFSAASFGYNYGCAGHTFEWNFGDNNTSTQQNPSHSYAQSGTFTVTLKITNPGQSVTVQKTVKVAGINNCPTMTANQNIFLQFLGAKSHCSAAGGTCAEDEEIAFGANALGYNFGCSPHTFLWTFGDNTTSTDQSPVHTYAGSGEFHLTLKITNSKQELTIPMTITVAAPATKRRSTRH